MKNKPNFFFDNRGFPNWGGGGGAPHFPTYIQVYTTYTFIVYLHLHFIHTLSLHTYTYILYIQLQVYTARALFSSNNFLETFPSGQFQHLSAHVRSCGVSSRTHQPKTFADIAATFVSFSVHSRLAHQ